MKHIRKLTVLATVLCILMSLTICANADMWLPPDEDYNMAVVEMAFTNNACGGINTFLSNYVEADLSYFDSTASDATAIAKTIKHLELNANLFGDKISRFIGDDGQAYMRVSGSLLEERVRLLFNRYIDATEHAGYSDGDVIVSADNYGGPIQVFASATDTSYVGDRTYVVYFDVYKVTGSFSNWYRTCFLNLPEEGLQYLGSGSAKVRYNGDNDATEFYSTDFTLKVFKMEVEGIPCTEPNLPYITEEPTVPATEAPTEPVQTIETEPAVQETESQDTVQTEPVEEDQQEGSENKDKGDLKLVILVLLVISCSVLAFLIVLLVFKRRK